MYFLDKIKSDYNDKKVTIFVDMDGVIADYHFGTALNFKTKRPIRTNIKTLKAISKLDNVELYILSICKTSTQIDDKNEWINKYAPFFKRENRIILSKDKYSSLKSMEIKCNFLEDFIRDNSKEYIIVIDDDNDILEFLNKKIPNIKLFQDSSIID